MRSQLSTHDDESTGRTLPADQCPDCDGTLRTDSGETCCNDCGLVIEACRIDRRGKRVFEDDAELERTGAPLTATRHDRGLSTEIGRGTDANGSTLSGKKRQQLARLRREHTRARHQSKAERNLHQGLSEIARLVSALDLSRSIREQASSLFRTAQQADLCRGRSIEAIATGSVYAACRLNHISRTLEEIVAVARVDHGSVTNGYRTLNTELDLPTPPQSPQAFVPSVASAVDVGHHTERQARAVAQAAQEAGHTSGKHPVGFAAACVAVAAARTDESVTQLSLADAADVAPTTVRAHRETIRAVVEQ